jgi:hypothetical protein
MFEKFAEHVELLAFLISIDRFHSWLLICIWIHFSLSL